VNIDTMHQDFQQGLITTVSKQNYGESILLHHNFGTDGVKMQRWRGYLWGS